MQEIELKFLEIHKEEMHKKLLSIGAEKKYTLKLRTTAFSGKKLSGIAETKKEALRVRSTGETVTITHKSPSIGRFKNRTETEIEVASSHEKAVELLKALGYTVQNETFKDRTHFELGKISFEIDILPNIPPYLEIETQSEEDMVMICEKLGLNIANGKVETINALYPEQCVQ